MERTPSGPAGHLPQRGRLKSGLEQAPLPEGGVPEGDGGSSPSGGEPENISAIEYNYKGSPVPEEAGRGPRKHGAQARRPGISNEYVCICTGVQRNGGPVMALTVNRATPSKEEIKEVFGGHIGAGALLFTDGQKAYQSLRSVAKGCSVVSVKAQKGRVFHLNTVNGFHSLIKSYYEAYRGVATKYLNRYNALFSMLYRSFSGLKDHIFSRLSKVSSVCYWSPVSAIKLQRILVL